MPGWLSQLKHLTSAQVVISRLMSSRPTSGSLLSAQKPALDPLSLSLSVPSLLVLSVSGINKLKKKKVSLPKLLNNISGAECRNSHVWLHKIKAQRTFKGRKLTLCAYSEVGPGESHILFKPHDIFVMKGGSRPSWIVKFLNSFKILWNDAFKLVVSYFLFFCV